MDSTSFCQSGGAKSLLITKIIAWPSSSISKLVYKFTNSFLSLGYQQLNADYSLFTLSHPGSSFVTVLIYVDYDFIVMENDSDCISKLKEHLNAKFHIKDLGKLK